MTSYLRPAVHTPLPPEAHHTTTTTTPPATTKPAIHSPARSTNDRLFPPIRTHMHYQPLDPATTRPPEAHHRPAHYEASHSFAEADHLPRHSEPPPVYHTTTIPGNTHARAEPRRWRGSNPQPLDELVVGTRPCTRSRPLGYRRPTTTPPQPSQSFIRGADHQPAIAKPLPRPPPLYHTTTIPGKESKKHQGSRPRF